MAGENQDVLEEIQREVKSFGNDFKKINDSLKTDLEAVRKIAEEAKGAAENPEVKSQIDALTTSVSEKQAAIEEIEKQVKAANERAEKVETAMKRSPVGSDKAEADRVKEALAFFEVKAAAAGNHKYGQRPTVETIDREGYDLWAKSFDTYLRANDERSIEAKALSVGSNPDGGYLVPTASSNRIIEAIYESSPLRQLATVETIGTSELEIPYDTDEAGAGWVGEEESRAETTTPQVGVAKIPVHEIYAKPKATQKLLEDAAINMEAWLARKIADKFSRVEATAFVSGNGVNKPRGILTYDAGTGRNKIVQYASGAATAITADAIVAMPYQIKSAYLGNSQWLMKRSTVAAVMLLKDGQGQYMWRPAMAAGQPSTLGGYAVNMADDMPVVGAGNLPIAFGDFRRGYTVVDRLGITTLRDPYSAKPFVEFYSRKRVGGAVVDFDAFALMKIAAS